MATYTVFAGVNGSGKSTLYKTGMISNLGVRIDIDALARDLDEQYTMFPIKAGRIAVNMINDCIKKKLSFNQETTLSGKSSLETIERAKKTGFYVSMWYIYINSPELAIQRVAARVRKGGHFVKNEVIKQRYRSSLINLKQAVSLCDEIYIYDNSSDIESGTNGGFRFLCYIQDGLLVESVSDMSKTLLDYLGLLQM